MGINDKKKIEALFELKMYTAHTIRMHITSIEDQILCFKYEKNNIEVLLRIWK